MKRRTHLFRHFAVAVLLMSSLVFAQSPSTTLTKTGYAPVNGLQMYYEIHGTGQPLILLHGGVVGIAMFGANVDALAKDRQVIAVELQGHGRTADIDRPLTCEGMADDVSALMKYLNIEKADVLGYSLGGCVALQFALRHPEQLRKLVVVSTPFSQDGWYPEAREAFKRMGPAAAQGIKQSPLAQQYPKVNWETLFTKIGQLGSKDYNWSKEVSGIKSPTLLVFGDADAIRPEHIVSFYELLGGGQRDAGLDGSGRSANQLAILPGVTHYSMSTAPGLAIVANGFVSK